MSKISVIMACGRGAAQSQVAVNKLRNTNPDVDMEIVVSSPGYILHSAINIEDQMIGNAKAMAQCYQHCSGDYIAWWSDEAWSEWYSFGKMLNFLVENEGALPLIGEFLANDLKNSRTSPDVTLICEAVGRQYARWGMASRKTLKQIGGFFDEEFISHWADPDLSMRCWENGGRVQIVKEAKINVCDIGDPLHKSNHEKYMDHDVTHFINKWKARYPQMTELPWPKWNTGREVEICSL